MENTRIEASVVIPAYREAINLAVLVPRLAAALRRAGLNGEIIVVDDFSDDGTDVLCASLSRSFPLRLLTRPEERGLASAVVLGLQEARGEILVVMDADMSHSPEMVPKLVAACRSPLVDFAVGSRYSKGSSVGATWSWRRWLNSRIASFLARGLTAARDPLSGFFAAKRAALRIATELNQPGDKIGLEAIVRCDCRRIVEVPIMFRNRVFRRNNPSPFPQREYGRQLAGLYQAKYPGLTRFIRFGLVGLSGAAVDLIGFSFLLLWAPLWFSRATAIACATLWNFAWNRQITFRSAADARVLRQLVAYFGATLLGAATNCSMTILLCNSCRLFNTIPTLAGAIGAAAGATVNFSLCRRWVFKESNAVCVDTDQVRASPASTANRRVA